jgi:hypothetical protein
MGTESYFTKQKKIPEDKYWQNRRPSTNPQFLEYLQTTKELDKSAPNAPFSDWNIHDVQNNRQNNLLLKEPVEIYEEDDSTPTIIDQEQEDSTTVNQNNPNLIFSEYWDYIEGNDDVISDAPPQENVSVTIKESEQVINRYKASILRAEDEDCSKKV